MATKKEALYAIRKMFVLSLLVKNKSLRYNNLWKLAEPFVRSKRTLGKILKELEREDQIIKRIPKKSKSDHVYYSEYQVCPDAMKTLSINLASFLTPLGRFELIKDCMDYLATYNLFPGVEPAGLAIEFWLYYYSNMFMSSSFRSLCFDDDQEYVEAQRRNFKIIEDKLFELLSRFKNEHSTTISKMKKVPNIDLFKFPTSDSVYRDLVAFLENYGKGSLKKDIRLKRKEEDFKKALIKREQAVEVLKCEKLGIPVLRWVCEKRYCNFMRKPRKLKSNFQIKNDFEHCVYAKHVKWNEVSEYLNK
jgi:hypothetical protein